MKNRKMPMIIIVVLLLTISAGLLINRNHAKSGLSTEIIAKQSVAKFNDKPMGKIKPIKEGSSSILSLYELTDGEFYYEVRSDGVIQSVMRPEADSFKSGNRIPKDIAEEKGKNIFKKLTDKIKKYKVSLQEKNFDVFYGYVIDFAEINDDGIKTGSFSSIELYPDGNLRNAVLHLENPNVLKAPVRVSKDQARDVVLNYCANHAILKKYINEITSTYSLERTTWQGEPVWNFSFKLPEISNNLDFVYTVDADSGEIVFKGEPALPGF